MRNLALFPLAALLAGAFPAGCCFQLRRRRRGHAESSASRHICI